MVDVVRVFRFVRSVDSNDGNVVNNDDSNFGYLRRLLIELNSDDNVNCGDYIKYLVDLDDNSNNISLNGNLARLNFNSSGNFVCRLSGSDFGFKTNVTRPQEN